MNVTILGLGWISGIWQICLISGHSARLSGWIFDYLDKKLTLKIFTISNFFFSLYILSEKEQHMKSRRFLSILLYQKNLIILNIRYPATTSYLTGYPDPEIHLPDYPVLG